MLYIYAIYSYTTTLFSLVLIEFANSTISLAISSEFLLPSTIVPTVIGTNMNNYLRSLFLLHGFYKIFHTLHFCA